MIGGVGIKEIGGGLGGWGWSEGYCFSACVVLFSHLTYSIEMERLWVECTLLMYTYLP